MNKLLLALLIGMLLGSSACEKKEEGTLPKVDSAMQAGDGDQYMTERDEFVRKAQKELDELGVKLAGLERIAADATGSAQERLDQKIVALQDEQKIVEEKLANLKSAAGEKWKELKAAVTEGIDKLKAAMQSST